MSETTAAASPAAVWRAGTMTVEDLERLADAIRPSWEVGLDVAGGEAGARVNHEAIRPTAVGFGAAPAGVAAQLGGLAGGSMDASLTSTAHSGTSPAVSPPGVAPPPTSAARAVPSTPSVAKPQATRGGFDVNFDESFDIPTQKSRAPLFAAMGGGALLLVGILYFSLSPSRSTVAITTSASAAANAPTPTAGSTALPPVASPTAESPTAAAPIAPPPLEQPAAAMPTAAAPPALAAVPVAVTPAAAIALPPVAAMPAPVAVAPAVRRAAHVPAPVAAAVVAPARRVVAPPPVRPAPVVAAAAPRPAATPRPAPRRVRSVGFVSANPY